MRTSIGHECDGKGYAALLSLHHQKAENAMLKVNIYATWLTFDISKKSSLGRRTAHHALRIRYE